MIGFLSKPAMSPMVNFVRHARTFHQMLPVDGSCGWPMANKSSHQDCDLPYSLNQKHLEVKP
jgi:hypothetical protein